ncbi:hypothetical protein ENSA5_20080 [Enhygromyxa salina]|uniref:DUF1415 domain-containing protein n=1 Tax=Enhygromyxa salina TaxID=215803 RepID=A0A2S9YCV1_9BACT|nr:DUF1415 family protein [Enhygromyxa salina]PRQ02831.1 hypothetical protein ENSA5_20080 [Enhygromyxa salina]
MSEPPGWPPDDAVIQAIHDRYQREIIEGLGLCPFARRSREQGRVHRPVFVATAEREPSPLEVAQTLAALVDADREAEIVLLTFPIPPGHRWWQPRAFEGLLAALREAWRAVPPPREFYMVSFHPRLELPPERALTADSLVSIIRRSPDPVIQCVDAELLDRVRRQAQVAARERMLAELEQRDPALAKLFANSVASDPELSSDIARQNFQAHGGEEDRAALERAIAALLADRDRAYGVGGED